VGKAGRKRADQQRAAFTKDDLKGKIEPIRLE
jgi:hypothetical protein